MSIRQDHGTFIQIDGIDGAGKSTLLDAARSWIEERGLRVFDSVAWCKEHGSHPGLADVGDAQALITAEPTHAGIGAEIRREIIREGTPYSAAMAAEAFALDRGVQYTRLILPFLRAQPSRIVIQDRGVLSSLAYQPLQSSREGRPDEVTLERLATLQGNRIALENPPDFFIFLDIDPQIALARLAGRTEKNDHHVFEAADFQIALAERFRDATVTAPLTERGTRLIVINGNKSKAEVALEMRRVLDKANRPVAL